MYDVVEKVSALQERIDALSRFGKIRRPDGSCLCVYCNREEGYWHPREDQLVSNGGDYYNCLHCHKWTGGRSGYCIYCPGSESDNEGQELVAPPSELPDIGLFEPGTKLHTQVLLSVQVKKVPGILFGPGEGYPAYRFRHRSGCWYPLSSDTLLAYRIMKVLADYNTGISDRGWDWNPHPNKIDGFWDEELASKHRG
jgi:hypothetical protein